AAMFVLLQKLSEGVGRWGGSDAVGTTPDRRGGDPVSSPTRRPPLSFEGTPREPSVQRCHLAPVDFQSRSGRIYPTHDADLPSCGVDCHRSIDARRLWMRRLRVFGSHG